MTVVSGVGSFAAGWWFAARALWVALAVAGVLIVAAPVAAAHPLGNFSVNTAVAVRIQPDTVTLDVVLDLAEIPTLQEFPGIDKGGIPAATASAYEASRCAALARDVAVTVAGRAVALRLDRSAVTFPEGNAGLPTTRLVCVLRSTAPVETPGTTLQVRTELAEGRVGWHEITAAGDGVALAASDVPAQSRSAMLTRYPEDALSSPLDQRDATMRVVAASATGEVTTGGADLSAAVPGPVERLTTAYTDLVGRERLTVGFALLALVLSVLLGAMHAFAPGHGKTLMAAYLVGKEGSLRQAAVIGLSVTATHTVGVLLLGLVLSIAVVDAPERVYSWLGLISGLLLVGIGAVLVRQALLTLSHGALAPASSPEQVSREAGGRPQRRGVGEPPATPTRPGGPRPTGVVTTATSAVTTPQTMPSPSLPPHDHGHGHDHDHDHDHGHDHDHDHGHDGTRRHSHGLFSHTHAPVPTSWRALVGVGFAGGLVPSPSALLVLLGGIALQRAWFGVILVIAYGAGMALALVATGLLLVHARNTLSRALTTHRWIAARPALVGAAFLPLLVALLVVIIGFVVMTRTLLTLS